MSGDAAAPGAPTAPDGTPSTGTATGEGAQGPGGAARAYRLVDQPGAGGRPVRQRFKQYPDRPRHPLPWPPGRAPQPARDMATLLAAVAALYAPTRLRFATAAARAATFGGPTTGGPPGDHGVHRPVPSGGGYYPVELYAAVVGDESLPSGVYHYDAVHHALERLATGDPRPGLAPAFGARPGPCTILLAARLWKNAPKYLAFGYRLGCVDTGVMVGQLLAAGPPAHRVRFMFADEPLGDFLGLEPELEAVYAAIELAASSTVDRSTAGGRRAGPVDAPSMGLMLDRARSAVADPAVVRLHRASIRPAPAGHAAQLPAAPGPVGGIRVGLPEPVVTRLGASLGRRRSAARFGPGALSAAELGTVLRHALTGYDSDVPGTGRCAQVTASCLVQRVDGIEPGVYRYDPAAHALVAGARRGPVDEVLRGVRYDEPGGGLWSTAACLYLFADLEPGLRTVGDRWYRILNMIAGIATQRACLAAAATGLACRPSFAYRGDAARRLLDAPPGHTDLMQILIGRPATRGGMIDFDLTTVGGTDRGPR